MHGHEPRKAAILALLVVCVGWALAAWVVAPEHLPAIPPSLLWHKVASVLVSALLVIAAFFVGGPKPAGMIDHVGGGSGGGGAEPDSASCTTDSSR